MATFSALLANGQQPQPSSASSVEAASFNRPPREAARQTVHFARRAARVGDEVEQTVSMEMRLATAMRRGSELAERNHTAIRSRNQRTMTTTEVEAGRAVAVRLQYAAATKTFATAEDGDAKSIANGLDDTPPTTQPVAEKTYFCSREPGDDGRLVITDVAGSIPPMEEYEIVAQHMDMVGRANPLAKFLAGRTIAVGETVEVPKQVADEIFNLGERFGEVTQFELTLTNTKSHDGIECAVFLARVEAASSDSSQMRLQVDGPIVIQAGTCRAVQVDLSGPIGMSETRGSYSTAYQMIGTGQLKMSTACTYRDAAH
jgi:hypothetical protein